MSRITKNSLKRNARLFAIVFIVVGILAVGGIFLVRRAYEQNLQPVNSSDHIVVVEIPRGATPHEIAVMLEEKGIIKKAWAFEWYIRNNGARDQLKAGTYELTPNMGVKQVVHIITAGEVATDVITILPGKRLVEIRESFIAAGFEPTEVDNALQADTYKNHPALVDKPANATLEGYIYPETFHMTADTTPEQIVRASLDQLQAHLTPSLRADIVRHGLTIHEGITLASIVEKEAHTPEDRRQVAQVFLKRRSEGIELGADATTRYAVDNFDQPLTAAELNSSHPYNTRKVKGLTPGPISNFTIDSLEAVASPAPGDYLFFVTGTDGVTRFSETFEAHEQLIEQYGVLGEE